MGKVFAAVERESGQQAPQDGQGIVHVNDVVTQIGSAKLEEARFQPPPVGVLQKMENIPW